MAPVTEAWAHLGALGALGAYSPLSAPRARVCVDYTELAPDAPIAPKGCELTHDWQAQHPRRDRAHVETLGLGGSRPAVGIENNQNKGHKSC